MKLTDFDNKPVATATKALQQSFELPFNVDKMSMPATQTMLQKVRGLISETKQKPNFYESQKSASYLKLVFMEQALKHHYKDLMNRPSPRIVLENEEVEKSQVILAAQDMADSIQKMLEEVGQMQVKELPALVQSIESEIGVNESQSFNETMTGQLDALSAALKEAFNGTKQALNGLTGIGGDMAAFDAGAEMGADLGAEAGMDAGLDAGAEMGADAAAEEMPPEEPETPAVGPVGRAKR